MLNDITSECILVVCIVVSFNYHAYSVNILIDIKSLSLSSYLSTSTYDYEKTLG